MSVAGLNTAGVTATQTAVTALNTSVTALTTQITAYSAALTTILNSSSALAKACDVADSASIITAFQGTIDAMKLELTRFTGNLTIPT